MFSSPDRQHSLYLKLVDSVRKGTISVTWPGRTSEDRDQWLSLVGPRLELSV